MNTDHELLQELKKKVAEVSGLNSPENWLQKDYEFLVFFIEERTGNRISLSTLKRIWKNENNRLPHISTLNALSQVAFEKDWLALKTGIVSESNGHKMEAPPENSTSNENQRAFKTFNVYAQYTLVILLLGMLLYLAYSYLKGESKTDLTNIENVRFSAQTTVVNQIPNSVVFDYDVTDIEADKFYIQQSWDSQRRVEISKENTTQTDIYYLPGYYNAKLIADSTILKEFPVHITTDDWFPIVFQDDNQIPIDESLWLKEAYLGISPRAFSQKSVDINQPLRTVFYNTREFNVDGDNFRFSTDFKVDEMESIPCPGMGLVIKGENDFFVLQVTNKGCESELGLRFADINYDGKTNDLTKLGTDVYSWQNVELLVKDKKAQLLLNEEVVFESKFSEDIGSLKEITYIFSGVGMLDNVVLEDEEGNVKYSDLFNE